MGLFRFILALNVMAFHILLIPKIGPLAVFSFFILSGFLMTTIMKENYGFGFSGVKAYALNRFLRLYPMHWILLALAAITIVIVGEEFSSYYNTSYGLPDDLSHFVFNIALIFPDIRPITVNPRLSPSSWALTIELFFYLLIGLGISRTKTITGVWFALSLTYWIIQSLLIGKFYSAYGDFLSASLPFSIGALLYYHKFSIYEKLRKTLQKPLVTVTGLFIANLIITVVVASYSPSYNALCAYFNLLITALMVVCLFYSDLPYSKKLDRILGDLSYPLYLFHWSAACLSTWLIIGIPLKGLSIQGLFAFCFALMFTVVVSLIANRFVNDPIQLIREKIKSKV